MQGPGGTAKCLHQFGKLVIGCEGQVTGQNCLALQLMQRATGNLQERAELCVAGSTSAFGDVGHY